MTILAFGINHKTAPVEIRDRFAASSSQLRQLLESWIAHEAIQEGVLLATCNRLEAYLVTDAAESALEQCRALFHELFGMADAALDQHLYQKLDADAVEHLFTVISGLDSLALGESQIAGQVREAYELAQQTGAAGAFLARLFEQAFHVNKRVREETAIGEGSISISHLAVDLAMQIFGDLAKRRTLILGAGKMSKLTLRHLKDHGASTIMIANRTNTKATALAQEFGLETHPWKELATALNTADIVISSTAAPHPVLHLEMLRAVMQERGNAPLFIIDIAAPRDAEPEVGQLYNVFLYNIDDLQQVLQENLSRRQHEAERARRIVEEEREKFGAWLKSRDARSVITDLRDHYDEIRLQELARLRAKIGEVDEEQWRQIEAFSNRLMNKHLHQPTSRLRNPQEEHPSAFLEIVRKLFNLGGR